MHEAWQQSPPIELLHFELELAQLQHPVVQLKQKTDIDLFYDCLMHGDLQLSGRSDPEIYGFTIILKMSCPTNGTGVSRVNGGPTAVGCYGPKIPNCQ